VVNTLAVTMHEILGSMPTGILPDTSGYLCLKAITYGRGAALAAY